MRRAWTLLLVATAAAACAPTRAPVITPPSPGPAAPTVIPVEPAPTPLAEAPTAPVTPAPPGTPAAAAPTPAVPGAESAAAPPPSPRTPAPAELASGRRIVLNFDNADIEAVIQAASEIVGFNYTLAPGVAGQKVTVQTSGRIPEEEIFNVLLAILEVHGITAVRAGNIYKILPITAAPQRPLPTIIGAEPDPSRQDEELITQIVPIRNVPPERIAATIRPFVQGGNVIVYGNLMLLTDTAGNIARLLRIASVLDVEAAEDELRIFQIRYAEAAEMARILNEFFSGRRARTPALAAVIPSPQPARPGVPAAQRAAAAARAATVSGAEEQQPLIIADERTNSLIVSAGRPDLEIIAKLLGQLDVETEANKRVFVYYVENVKAGELAATLTEVFGEPQDGDGAPRRPLSTPTAPGPVQPTPTPTPGAAVRAAGMELEPGVVEGQVKIIADEPNNALIITTFPGNWPLIEDTIRKLDRIPKQVVIEVLVAEITLDENTQLGIEWSLRSQRDITIGGNTYNIGAITSVGSAAGVPSGGLSFLIFETDRFIGLLNAFASSDRLSILSSPHILTSENKTAVINVSQSIPVVTGQTVSQAGTVAGGTAEPPSSVLNQSVEYRDAGIILTVTPRISDKRVVALDVKQTVNDVGAPQPPSGSPIIIKREAETSMVLRDNQTLVLGGLIQTNRSIARQGVPWLSRIPILGALFGATNRTFNRTELLLLITPRVIGDPSEGQPVLEQLIERSRELQRSIRTHPSVVKPQRSAPESAPSPPPEPEPEPEPESKTTGPPESFAVGGPWNDR